MNENEALIFLQPFNIVNPTRDQQTSFIMFETFCYGEYAELGEVYDNAVLHDKDLGEFIPAEVKRLKPTWVVAEGDSATAAMGLKQQKKVLVNPKVTFDDLNNVPYHMREHTWGFFDRNHEEDYNRFQSVYPNAAWYPDTRDLNLYIIKDLVSEIIGRAPVRGQRLK